MSKEVTMEDFVEMFRFHMTVKDKAQEFEVIDQRVYYAEWQFLPETIYVDLPPQKPDMGEGVLTNVEFPDVEPEMVKLGVMLRASAAVPDASPEELHDIIYPEDMDNYDVDPGLAIKVADALIMGGDGAEENLHDYLTAGKVPVQFKHRVRVDFDDGSNYDYIGDKKSIREHFMIMSRGGNHNIGKLRPVEPYENFEWQLRLNKRIHEFGGAGIHPLFLINSHPMCRQDSSGVLNCTTATLADVLVQVSAIKDCLFKHEWEQIIKIYKAEEPALEAAFKTEVNRLLCVELSHARYLTPQARNQFYYSIQELYLVKKKNDWIAVKLEEAIGRNSTMSPFPRKAFQDVKVMMFTLNRADSLALKKEVTSIHLLN